MKIPTTIRIDLEKIEADLDITIDTKNFEDLDDDLIDEIEDYASDYISDEVGFLHDGWEDTYIKNDCLVISGIHWDTDED